MEECFGSFRVAEDYTWRDDIMTVTRRIINEIDDARFSNIAVHFDVDLSEIREFLDAKRRKHLAPMTNVDKLRAMSDEKLAEWMAAHSERSAVCPNFGAHGCQASCRQCWLDWLKQEAKDD